MEVKITKLDKFHVLMKDGETLTYDRSRQPRENVISITFLPEVMNKVIITTLIDDNKVNQIEIEYSNLEKLTIHNEEIYNTNRIYDCQYLTDYCH